jgi:hypothetical protein
MGYGHRMSLLPAINLSQVSEFALVILLLGVQAQHISRTTLDISTYAFVVMAVASTYLVTRSDGVVRRFSPWLSSLGIRDLGDRQDHGDAQHEARRIYFLGFFRTESSLLEELARSHPKLISELAVVDFNPRVNEELRRRGVRVIYGDISQRDTLQHAGVGQAEILLCGVPGDLLKGITKVRLVRQLRDINPRAKIIVTTTSFADVPDLYAAGADFVSVPRLAEAGELCQALQAAQRNELGNMRLEMDRHLANRAEVVP